MLSTYKINLRAPSDTNWLYGGIWHFANIATKAEMKLDGEDRAKCIHCRFASNILSNMRWYLVMRSPVFVRDEFREEFFWVDDHVCRKVDTKPADVSWGFAGISVEESCFKSDWSVSETFFTTLCSRSRSGKLVYKRISNWLVHIGVVWVTVKLWIWGILMLLIWLGGIQWNVLAFINSRGFWNRFDSCWKMFIGRSNVF